MSREWSAAAWELTDSKRVRIKRVYDDASG
jgi:hypothetical protein